MAEEKRGIEETKDVLAFVFSFITAVKKSYEDIINNDYFTLPLGNGPAR